METLTDIIERDEAVEAPPEPPRPSASFAQDKAYELCTACSALQREAGKWRDLTHRGDPYDPALIVKAARSTAKTLRGIADQIELETQKCAA